MPEAAGTLSLHMVQHLMVMNLAAPLLSWFLAARLRSFPWRSWPYATAAQLVLLWGWHSPAALSWAMADWGPMLLMHLSLGAVAVWFWLAVLSVPVTSQWQSVFALLVSGKLFCLLGALLVFAPRLLFAGMGHHHAPAAAALADQQLAGLIMLTACPLSYVVAGIIVSTRWFLAIERGGNA